MSDDNIFWLKFWKYTLIAFCVIVVSAMGSCQANKYQLRKAIELSASPMEAACAFGHGVVSDGSLCMAELIGRNSRD